MQILHRTVQCHCAGTKSSVMQPVKSKSNLCESGPTIYIDCIYVISNHQSFDAHGDVLEINLSNELEI